MQDAIPPKSALLNLLYGLRPGIRKVSLYESHIDDSIFSVLASSQAAPEIESLSLGIFSRITDASLHLWASFSNLTELELKKNPFLDPPSFRAISRLQKVQRVSIELSKRSVGVMFRKFLKNDSLPALTHFDAKWKDRGSTMTDTLYGILLDSLKTRFNPAKLERIGLDHPMPDNADGDDDLLNDVQNLELLGFTHAIHKICPNLKYPLPWTRLLAYHDTGAYKFVEIQVPRHVVILGDTNSLICPRRFPNLESLHFEPEDFDDDMSTSWHQFSCLRDLKWYGNRLHEVSLGFPPTLRKIEILCRGQTPSKAISVFLEKLYVDVPHLESLNLHFCEKNALTKDHVTFILAKFLDLKRLKLDNCKDVPRDAKGVEHRQDPVETLCKNLQRSE
jgi:hypothetical protein